MPAGRVEMNVLDVGTGPTRFDPNLEPTCMPAVQAEETQLDGHTTVVELLADLHG